MPMDNSYSRNLSDSRENKFERLAGIPLNRTPAQVTTIASEPFSIIVTENGTPQAKLFVLVDTKKYETYIVMFHKHGLITENNTIESIKNRDLINQEEIMNTSFNWL